MIFSPQSKVWIYQSNRKLTPQETAEIQQKLDEFTSEWKAHGHQLKAKGEIFHDFFIVLTADQEASQSTGCSIDASVRLMKELEIKYNLDLFNRFNMAYKLDDEVHVVPKEDFETLITIKKINSDTIIYNNLVQTLAEFEQKWEVPMKDSWHQNIFATQLAS